MDKTLFYEDGLNYDQAYQRYAKVIPGDKDYCTIQFYDLNILTSSTYKIHSDKYHEVIYYKKYDYWWKLTRNLTNHMVHCWSTIIDNVEYDYIDYIIDDPPEPEKILVELLMKANQLNYDDMIIMITNLDQNTKSARKA